MLQGKLDKSKIWCLFIVGALFLAKYQPVAAQGDFKKEFYIGINGGTTISSVNFTSSKFQVRENKLTQGVGGVSVLFISEKNLGIQGEINYSQRGWDEYNPDEASEFQYARRLNYLELPVLTHIYFNMGNHFRAIFNLGPQLGLFLNEKTLKSSMTDEDKTRHPYYKDKVQRPFDWGLCFGGGIEFRTGRKIFILDGRYYYGLSDIFNNSKSDYFASSSNQIISIKLTYFFKTKNKIFSF